MKVEKYRNSHVLKLYELLSLRGLAHELKNTPKIGFIATRDRNPVAAGFLRKVEGGVCLIDSLISNPFESSIDRHNAIDAIVDALIDAAKINNSDKILAYSLDTGTLERASRHGFVKLPHSVIALNLKE